MADDWSETEVDLIIADYFAMLYNELSGLSYNKTEHRNNLLRLLTKRTAPSVEYKHRNISAALAKINALYIKGYKPALNYQAILDQKVSEYLHQHSERFEPKFEQYIEQPISSIASPNFETFIDEAPEISSNLTELRVQYFKPIKKNYLEQEQRNRSLGLSGEDLVLRYEKWRLIRAGKSSLADKIEWTSNEKGDGAGFDILSKNVDGSDRFIEVKTTRLAKDTPIFFSKTEYDFSISRSKDFWLYRVFNAQDAPKMFTRNGRFDDFCRIEPVSFKGHF
jgi:hypothetical protein